MSEALTDKQLRFAMEYPTDYNATRAAIRAGYSKKTAYSQGQRLLKNVEVQKKIKERQKELLDATFVTQERIVSELAKTAFYDIDDFVQVKDEVVDAGDGNTVTIQQVVIRTDVPAEKRGAIMGIKKTQAGIEVKLGDKIKALEDLAGMCKGASEGSSDGREKDVQTLAGLMRNPVPNRGLPDDE